MTGRFIQKLYPYDVGCNCPTEESFNKLVLFCTNSFKPNTWHYSYIESLGDVITFRFKDKKDAMRFKLANE